MTWTGGSLSVAGKTLISSTGTLFMGGDFVTLSLNGLLENDGTATWSGLDGAIAMNGGTLTNVGTFNNVSSNYNLEAYNNGGSNAFNNSGTFNEQGSDTTTFNGVVFDNTGTVNVSAGALAFGSNQSLGGAITVSASGTLAITGGTTTFTTPLTLAGTLAVAGGTLIVNAALSVSNLNVAGNLTGPANVTVTGTMTWATGTLALTGKTLVASTATLAFSGRNYVYLNGLLENDGTAMWTSDVWMGMNGGTFNNVGTFDANSVQTLLAFNNGGINVFNNSGTFNEQGSAGISFNGVVFNNSGTVNVGNGALSLPSGGNHTGTFAVTGGATLSLSGNQTLGGATTVSTAVPCWS